MGHSARSEQWENVKFFTKVVDLWQVSWRSDQWQTYFIIIIIIIIIICYHLFVADDDNDYDLCGGHAVAQLVEKLCYKPEGRGFDSRWCQ